MVESENSSIADVGRYARIYAKSVVGLLLLTALSKFAMAASGAPLLRYPDAVLGFLQRGEMLLAAVALEMLVVACMLFWGVGNVRALIAVAWLATVFGAYRLLGWALRTHAPCDCLGSITHVLGLEPATAEFVARVLFGYLLVGSYAFLLCGRRFRLFFAETVRGAVHLVRRRP